MHKKKLLFLISIECYFDLILQRNTEDNSLINFHAMGTHFWTKYDRDGYDSVKSWIREDINIFEKDAFFVPMHFGNHWALTIFDFRGRRACCYDSLGIDRSNQLSKMMEYLKLEQNRTGRLDYDLSNIEIVDSQKAPGECIARFYFSQKLDTCSFNTKIFLSIFFSSAMEIDKRR